MCRGIVRVIVVTCLFITLWLSWVLAPCLSHYAISPLALWLVKLMCVIDCHWEVFHLSIRTAVVHKKHLSFPLYEALNRDSVLLTPLYNRSCKESVQSTLACNCLKLTSLCLKTQLLLCSTSVRSQRSASFVSPLQVSIPVDYSNPPTVKNHNEVLRCFSLLGIEALVCLFVFIKHTWNVIAAAMALPLDLEEVGKTKSVATSQLEGHIRKLPKRVTFLSRVTRTLISSYVRMTDSNHNNIKCDTWPTSCPGLSCLRLCLCVSLSAEGFLIELCDFPPRS